jgi:PRTRC genetic system protein B
MSVLNNYVELFVPSVAIIAYQGNEENSQEWYLESHPIVNGEFMEGRPLQQETLHAMLELMYTKETAERKVHRFIPANMLYGDVLQGGDYKFIWYRPEEKRSLFFSEKLELKNGEAWVPAMVYVASRKRLSVFALDSNDYPTEGTKLFRAPFHNVSENGSVCLGSAKANFPKAPSYANVMKYYEDLFWVSEFSHMTSSNFCKSPGNLVWKKLLSDSNLKWSDMDELLISRQPKTINDLLK